MKKIGKAWSYFLLLFGILLIGCKDDEPEPAPIAPSNLIATVVSDNQIQLSWTDNSTNETGFKIERKSGTTDYSVISSAAKDATSFTDNNLEQNTTYTYRVYAVNVNDEPSAKSNEVSATTTGLPVLTTLSVTAIMAFEATSGGTITSDGGSAITAKGIVWGTAQNPTIALTTKTSDGTGTDSYSSSIGNLNWNTVYFVRAYATNGSGTGYGQEVTFTTGQVSIQTETPSSITYFAAVSGGSVGDDGGYPITEKGVVWDTQPNPLVSLSTKTSEGAGTGVFTSALPALVSNVKYYVRAYAISSGGTAYGPSKEFTTLGLEDNDGNIYPVVQIGTQLWMSENLKTTKYSDDVAITLETDNTTWAGLTTGAYCWFNNDEAANTEFFGALYNWYAVETGKVCPSGWHVPTDAEWTTLGNFLGGNSVAGGKMKVPGTEFWTTPNTGATNESGFNGRSVGARVGSGAFAGQGSNADYWTSTQKDAATAYPRDLQFDTGALNIEPNGTPKDFGFAVRCIQN